MKNAFYFLLLISISFTTSATKDKFASILQQFVELNDAMGVQKEDVGVIIAQVKNTLDAGSKQFTNFFRSIESHCTSASASLSSTLKGLNSNVNEAKTNLNNWNKNVALAVKDQKDSEKALQNNDLAKAAEAAADAAEKLDMAAKDAAEMVKADKQDKAVAQAKEEKKMTKNIYYNTKLCPDN